MQLKIIIKSIFALFKICISLLTVCLFSSCASDKQLSDIKIQNGILDLSKFNFDKNNTVALNGDWQFITNKQKTFSAIPHQWENSYETNVYLLKVILPKNTTDLALKLDGINSAYRLIINDKYLAEVGKVGTQFNNTSPQFKPLVIPILQTDSALKIKIEVANYHHFKGGILKPLILGKLETLKEENLNASMTGGLLLGVCFLNLALYITLFVLMKKEKYFLFYAIYTAIVIIHLLCLSNRLMYEWLGWLLAYKIELATIFLGLLAKLYFYDSLFKDLISKKWLYAVSIIMILQANLVFVLPAPWFTYADKLIPINFLLILISCVLIFIKANQQNRDGAMVILLFNMFLVGLFIHENFFVNKNVNDIELLHIGVIFYVIGLSIILVKRIANTFIRENTLRLELKNANEKLEKQKHTLEEIVERRTSQLIEAEKQSHQLQLEKKERDLDILASNNLVKLQFFKNLIEELESLSKNEKELKSALNLLLTKLKAQANVEEKLEILQKDLDRVNAEFYQRLTTQFPDLSKTERELCAYIKLNLSNKDIAELRKTSLNTINVLRSRLRKKLNLGRDEELESFILRF